MTALITHLLQIRSTLQGPFTDIGTYEPVSQHDPYRRRASIPSTHAVTRRGSCSGGSNILSQSTLVSTRLMTKDIRFNTLLLQSPLASTFSLPKMFFNNILLQLTLDLKTNNDQTAASATTGSPSPASLFLTLHVPRKASRTLSQSKKF